MNAPAAEERAARLDAMMMAMPLQWRGRWCSGGICACMGAANCSGNVGGSFTKEEWEQWVANNPDKVPPEEPSGPLFDEETFNRIFGKPPGDAAK